MDTDNIYCYEITYGQPINNWYNRVYLCYEDTNNECITNGLGSISPIKGFNCFKYYSFQTANIAWNTVHKGKQNGNKRVTMLPICKWVPEIFDKYLLDYKLKSIYWKGQHKIHNKYIE
jgi:hypothetical protein